MKHPLLIAATLSLAATFAAAVVVDDFKNAAAWIVSAGTGANRNGSAVVAQPGDKPVAKFTAAHTKATGFDYVRFDRTFAAPVDLTGGSVKLRIKAPADARNVLQLQILDASGAFIERALKPEERDGNWHDLDWPVSTFGLVKNPELTKLTTVRFESVGDVSATDFSYSFEVSNLELVGPKTAAAETK